MSHDLPDRTGPAGAEHAAARRARPVRPALLAGERREAADHHVFRGTD
ncbi:hypothetical protein [Streptomyces sp. H27-S2]|nr:hypothetical protein [Streptomyces sp. H27-S2]MCY0955174.1 hypothetical protein [Streptomyces sp. H27-S2]